MRQRHYNPSRMRGFTVRIRFWDKVAICASRQAGMSDDCWHWAGHCNRDGYGRLMVNGKTEGAHRVSWSLHHGEIPKKAHILHRCDNPRCVNPGHLFIGDQRSNVRDMVKKSRHQHGESNGNSKLTEKGVADIIARLASGERNKELAAEYGVKSNTISAILSGRTWRHVTGLERRG